jgi:hypothetical protein
MQFRSYGAEPKKIILANLGCYKLKATQGIETISSAEAKRYIDFSNLNPFSRLSITDGGASTRKGNHSATHKTFTVNARTY